MNTSAVTLNAPFSAFVAIICHTVESRHFKIALKNIIYLPFPMLNPQQQSLLVSREGSFPRQMPRKIEVKQFP